MPSSRSVICRLLRVAVCGFPLIFVLACSDGSGSGGPDVSVALQDMMPATTRGFVDVSLDDEAELRDLLAGGGETWRQHPGDILRWLDPLGMLVAEASELLLVQVTDRGDEFVLLASLAASSSERLFSELTTTELDDYHGHPRWTVEESGQVLSRPDQRTWIMGSLAAVESVLDVRAGIAAGIEQSPIATYLVIDDDSVTDGDSTPVIFVYGLAALYADVATPGTGDSSLNPARAVRGSLDLDRGEWLGGLEFFTPNAEVYTERLVGLLPEGTPEVFQASGEILAVDVAAMAADDFLALFKSMVHGMNSVDYAEAVNHGGNPPWMNFDVGENPNSIFINFEFRDAAQRTAFEAEHLPAGFSLAPLRILATDVPRYYLVLNMYQSSGGLVEGARAEWSVFVHDPETGQPRFLVVQASAENFTADSVNLLTPPEPVSHDLVPDAIVSYVGVVDEETEEESTYFSSRINWPQPPSVDAYFSREFVIANDYIFWGNAVADRGLYNGTVHARPASLISDSEMTLEDNSRWTSFVNPEPVHAVVYHNPLEIVISPWWNLEEDYLDITQEYRQELIDFKNGLYPGMVLGNAEGAMQGERPSLTATRVGVGADDHADGNPVLDSVSTTFFHFAVRDADALLDALGVAGRYTPVAIPYYEDEEPQMYLTLALYQLEGDPCGARADWQLMVENDEGRAMTLQVETLSANACLDAVSLLGLSAVVGQQADSEGGGIGPYWDTRIESVFIRLHVGAQWVSASEDLVLPSQAWIEAGDEVCSLSGVCSANFYDGDTLGAPVLRMSKEDVDVHELNTPFDAFIDREPALVTVRDRAAILGTNPWISVPVFGTH